MPGRVVVHCPCGRRIDAGVRRAIDRVWDAASGSAAGLEFDKGIARSLDRHKPRPWRRGVGVYLKHRAQLVLHVKAAAPVAPPWAWAPGFSARAQWTRTDGRGRDAGLEKGFWRHREVLCCQTLVRCDRKRLGGVGTCCCRRGCVHRRLRRLPRPSVACPRARSSLLGGERRRSAGAFFAMSSPARATMQQILQDRAD